MQSLGASKPPVMSRTRENLDIALQWLRIVQFVLSTVVVSLAGNGFANSKPKDWLAYYWLVIGIIAVMEAICLLAHCVIWYGLCCQCDSSRRKACVWLERAATSFGIINAVMATIKVGAKFEATSIALAAYLFFKIAGHQLAQQDAKYEELIAVMYR